MAGGTHRFAHPDLANTRGDGGQHDVHDSHATYHQSQHRDEQQNCGQRVRGFAGNTQQLSQVVDLVHGLRTMSRLESCENLFRRSRHLPRIGDREEQLLHFVACHEKAGYGVRNQDRLFRNFRLPKVSTRSLKTPTMTNGSPSSFISWPTAARSPVKPYSQVHRDYRHFAACADIALIEKASGQDLQIAYPLVLRRHAENEHISLFAAGNGDAVVQLEHGRRRGDAGYLTADRVHIFKREIVAGSAPVDAAALVVRHHHVGADGLDLAQDVFLPCEPDGDHQNERCGANHHAKSCQHEPRLLGAKGLDCDTDGLAENQLGMGCPLAALIAMR